MSVRRVNQPMPAAVVLGGDERPARVSWSDGVRSHRGGVVEHVIDVWYVDDAWWSDQPVQRIYYECQLEHGARIIVVYDCHAQEWYAQR